MTGLKLSLQKDTTRRQQAMSLDWVYLFDIGVGQRINASHLSINRLDSILADCNSIKHVMLPYFGKGGGYQVAPFIRHRRKKIQNQVAYARMFFSGGIDCEW